MWTDVSSLISAVHQQGFAHKALFFSFLHQHWIQRSAPICYPCQMCGIHSLRWEVTPRQEEACGNGSVSRVTRSSCQTVSPASGSHLLTFDPCRNKHERKTNVCTGREGKSVFQHLSVNVTWHRDDFFFPPGRLASSVCPAMFSWDNLMREGG